MKLTPRIGRTLLAVAVFATLFGIGFSRRDSYGAPLQRDSARSVTVRLDWLQQREKVHRFGCRHPQVERSSWHCKALVWTSREYREARAEYEYNWRLWLPDKYARIGACETGFGKRPGRWDWNSGPYQGAFGFAVSSWDQFRLPGYPPEAYQASPWQQYQVALAIHARYGFSGWGCRNA